MSMTVMRISRQGVGEQVAPRTRGSPPGVVAGGGGEQVAPSDAGLARRRPARFIALVLATGLIPPSFPDEETTAPLPAA